ncbi:FAD binding domain-containing protein [Ramlibacter sp.]|uniref:FAD binding domain-containing protein n=1 Tax=Ramlibacter sp. TaxID=1917967 RepID=UPI003D15031D
MKLPPFELRAAESLEHALDVLASLGSDASVLAGGQSLLPLLRYRMARPHVLLDINRIASLSKVEASGDELRIGALVRHWELETLADGIAPSPLGSLLREHAHGIAFRPIRTRGTAVGSLVHADPKGDWPLAFLALDAQVELASKRGVRRVAARDFITGPLQSDKSVDELATAVILPRTSALRRWGRAKLQHRAGEYAMSSALALETHRGWECWLGAAGDKPFALPGLASLLKGTSTRRQLIDAATASLRDALPDATDVERRRHAAVAADAAERAMKTRP